MISKDYISNTALITKDKSYNYTQLFEKINQYSQLFNGKTYKRISIFSENREEWIFAFYAGWLNNCTVVPIDFLASVGDASYILNDCAPDLVFYSNTTKDKIEKSKERINYNPDLINFDDLNLSDTSEELNWEVPKDKDDTAVIIYTSGTTGSPKGVMLTFNNLLANVDAVSTKVKIFTPERQTLMLLPMHHIFPLAGAMIAPLAVGGTIVMTPSMQSSDILETLKNNKVNIMIGVPRFYELLYKGIKAKVEAKLIGRVFYKLVKFSGSQKLGKKIFKKVHEGFGGHVKYLVAGGAALNMEVGEYFKTLGFLVLEGFGMTEAAPMITFPRPEKIKLGSTGQALPGLTMEIRDGEIVAKGPNIMKGYYNRPEETAEVLKDGWLYTGDLGKIDKDGFLYITGRKKEIIVLPNGKNINPVELEEKLHNIPEVNEAAVFMHNEMLNAIIVPDYDTLTRNGIKSPEAYFKEKVMPEFNKELTSYKRIMKFSFIKEDIPRTRLGKIQRFKLADLLDKPKEKKKVSEEVDFEEYRVIKTFIESQVDMTISPDDHLEYDIAMDSLGKITLIDFIEKTFGVKIEEDKLINFPSVRQMVEHIREHKLFHKIEMPNWSEILKEKIHLNLPKTWPTQTFLIKSFRNLFKVYFRFNGEGIKNIPEGPAIITPNHQSYFDGLFVTAFLKRKVIKETYFYAKRKHIKSRFLNFMANRNNVIIMDLNLDLKESIQKMAEVLKRGKKIIIFPEGTRSQTGRLGDFKKTFAILSKELNVPVIPVAITGAYNALPRGSRFPKPFTKVNVNYLQPVYPNELSFDGIAEKVKFQISEKV